VIATLLVLQTGQLIAITEAATVPSR
jgi:hypothetical protein